MAAKIHGRLGAIALAATTDTELYECPAARKATGNITICNRNNSSVTVRLAYIDGTSPASVANEDYLEYETTIGAYGVLEKTGVTITAAHSLMVRSSSTNVSASYIGIEEDV